MGRYRRYRSVFIFRRVSLDVSNDGVGPTEHYELGGVGIRGVVFVGRSTGIGARLFGRQCPPGIMEVRSVVSVRH